jgi:RecA/RadA recombinase
MAKNFLNSFVEELKDEDTTMMVDGLGSAEYTGHIDTGCYALNALASGQIYGGIPNNQCTAFVGDSAVGKTYIAMSVVKFFLENASDGAGVFYADTEAAVRKQMLIDRGIDPSRVMRTEPVTIEDFRTIAIRFLDSYKANVSEKQRLDNPMLMVLDSLGALSSNKEISDTAATDQKKRDTKDMTKASLLKGMFRVLRQRMAKIQVPMIVTNHVYSSMDQYKPKEISGGSGLVYAGDLIIDFRTNQLEDKEERRDGVYIIAHTFKSRLTKKNQEVKLKLSYTTGLDRYYGLLDIAERSRVFKRVSTKYLLPDGTKVFGKEINEHPEQVFQKHILDDINEGAQKLFMYGKKADEQQEVAETAEVDD